MILPEAVIETRDETLLRTTVHKNDFDTPFLPHIHPSHSGAHQLFMVSLALTLKGSVNANRAVKPIRTIFEQT